MTIYRMSWIAGLLVASVSLAQTNPAPVLPVDVSPAVTKGINYLRAVVATNDGEWVFATLSNKVIGWKTNAVHFKEVEITIPGYKYENYEVMVGGSSPTDPLRRITRRRIVGRDPSKDKKETRVVQDRNGPIVRQIPHPIYEKESAAQWPYGALGNNGMALLALRRCGVAGDDPLVTQPANNLLQLLTNFGLPDHTADLAWLTAGLAVMPGDDFKQWTERCATKLLDAQITSGPATGLWGPVAINPAMVSAFVRVMSRWGDEKKTQQAELTLEQKRNPKGKPTVKANRLREEVEKLELQMAALQEQLPFITQQGLLMFDVFGIHNQGRLRLKFQGNQITVESLPYLIQNQLSADLESTALVLMALRVAFENDRLPLKTWRPEFPKSTSPAGVTPLVGEFPAARGAREILDLATRAVTGARTAGGQWPELNIVQPVTSFAWLKSIPQISPELFPKLPQPITLASICRGASSLANIQTLLTGQARFTALETDSCRPLIRDLVSGKSSLLASNDLRSPYEILPHLAAPRLRAKVGRTDFKVWNELADWIAGRQSAKDGNWGREKGRVIMPPSSLLAMQKVIPEIVYEPAPPEANRMSKNYDKPHLSPGYFMKSNFTYRHTAVEATYFTTLALLFLADGLPEGWTPPAVVAEAAPE
ncbi:MAG: hypothetical protein PCFJNLEI_02442 [Verrucomicrobiae bacterium]|nr:hypothetical protein [Verrucomicrobiae bacterium]